MCAHISESHYLTSFEQVITCFCGEERQFEYQNDCHICKLQFDVQRDDDNAVMCKTFVMYEKIQREIEEMCSITYIQ